MGNTVSGSSSKLEEKYRKAKPEGNSNFEKFSKEKDRVIFKPLGRLGRGKVLSNYPSQSAASISNEPHFLSNKIID